VVAPPGTVTQLLVEVLAIVLVKATAAEARPGTRKVSSRVVATTAARTRVTCIGTPQEPLEWREPTSEAVNARP
jgi:hypothetical protein